MSSAMEWRPIPGHNGRYDVNSTGVVRSWTGRPGLNERRKVPLILSFGWHTFGYRQVALSARSGERKITKTCHRLVALAFIGDIPQGMQVAHLNGVPTDNRVENLVICTASENNLHKRLHGTDQSGERGGRHKLTWDQVHLIRKRRANGERGTVLANEYGVTHRNMFDILAGETWIYFCKCGEKATPDTARRCDAKPELFCGTCGNLKGETK